MCRKKLIIACVLVVCFLFCQWVYGQNPEKIRTVSVVKQMEINDESGEFIFAHTGNFKKAPDNSIFMTDKNELYQFDEKGKYVRNFLKQGEGPGEFKFFSNYYFTKTHLIMVGTTPFTLQKISLADASLIDEFRDNRLNAARVLFGDHRGAWLSFENTNYGSKEKGYKTGIKQTTHKIYFMNAEKKVSDTKLSFHTELGSYIFKTEDGSIMSRDFPITEFIQIWDGNRYWYIFNTRRYAIKQVDLHTNKIIREITTNYRPVKYVTLKNEDKWKVKLYDHFKRKYHNDIFALKIYKKNLLVFTSTFDKQGNPLVHMYNSQGKLKDRFFLNIPRVKTSGRWAGARFQIIQNHLWASHTDEDDNTVVVRYKFQL